tara:strand:- start:326 stop:514 length:189 start_codon:yes stop_codon:yes gene_type:complete
MRKFKSISIRPDTYNRIKELTETLLPKVKLSSSQVIDSAINNCSCDDFTKDNHEIRIQEKRK